MPQIAPTSLIDESGRPVAIARSPFAEGGEGAVYEVVDDPSMVAKVYNAPQPPDRSEKLRLMAGLARPELLKIAAWPTATLHRKNGGPVAGILMPKVSGCKELHHLYSVAQRKKDYPEADWRFLAHAARNCAIAFETLHNHGHVIGDVNQKNLMVSNQAIVKFVDCDSFQVRGAGGSIYRCPVGVPEFTPPELQGKSFRDVDRDSNHDLFGLGVLIFHLLMMGRHPFSGVYLEPGDMPLEKAIQGGRFAYARDPRSTRMHPPPNTLPSTTVGDKLIELFEKSFSTSGQRAAQPRPTAQEWKLALDEFIAGLGQCKIDSKHVYSKHLTGCPWCELLGSKGLLFFPPGPLAAGAKGPAFDLLAVWGEIERVRPPLLAYHRPHPTVSPIQARPVPRTIPPPTPRPVPHPMPTTPGSVDVFLDWVSGLGFAMGFILSFIAPPVGAVCLMGFGTWFLVLRTSMGRRRSAIIRSQTAEMTRVSQANQDLLKAWESENKDWCREFRVRSAARVKLEEQLTKFESLLENESSSADKRYRSIRGNLDKKRSEYDEAKAEYSRALTELTLRSAQMQLDRHLDSYLIRDAKLTGMNTGRISSLGSFGIESAFDVDRLTSVKVTGIGPVLTERLLNWRQGRMARG